LLSPYGFAIIPAKLGGLDTVMYRRPSGRGGISPEGPVFWQVQECDW
jgi:hypothetical protein